MEESSLFDPPTLGQKYRLFCVENPEICVANTKASPVNAELINIVTALGWLSGLTEESRGYPLRLRADGLDVEDLGAGEASLGVMPPGQRDLLISCILKATLERIESMQKACPEWKPYLVKTDDSALATIDTERAFQHLGTKDDGPADAQQARDDADTCLSARGVGGGTSDVATLYGFGPQRRPDEYGTQPAFRPPLPGVQSVV